MSDNTLTSCKFHYGMYSAISDRWDCCGERSGCERCSEGYHIPNISLEGLIQNLMSNNHLENNQISDIICNLSAHQNVQQNDENHE